MTDSGQREFRAKFPGHCAKCSGSISVGDLITWSRNAARGKRVYHQRCAHQAEWKTEPVPQTPGSGNAAAPAEGAGDGAGQGQGQGQGGQGEPNQSEGQDKGQGEGQGKEQTAQTEDILRQVEKMLQDLRKDVKNDARDAARAEVERRAPALERIEVKLPNGETRATPAGGVHHRLMTTLLYLVAKRHNVYLWGPSQAGKSTATHTVGQILGLEYYYISLNPQTPDSRLMGYMDATGKYIPTAFYHCYKNGGVFNIDEVDNASASLLTTLNSANGNGRAAFPCGMVERHRDCIIVATGNTPGRGGTPQYPERRALDGAFGERFTYLHWTYDAALETTLVERINPALAAPVLKWIRGVREYSEKKGLKVLATPTSAMKLAEYAFRGTVFATPEDAAEAVLFKGIGVETREQILREVPIPQGLRDAWGK